MSDLLELTDVSVDYRGGAQAVAGVSATVGSGQIVGVVGRNGSGKTSLLRAVAGFLPSELVRVGGSIVLDGREIARHHPGQTGRAGVVMVLERDKAFPGLTVAEHFRVIPAGKDEIEKAIAHFPALDALRNRRAGLLSGGERQMLALAMAIARSPRVLLVDEMSLGLAPVVVHSLLSVLGGLRDELGLTVVLVEQDLSLLADVADQIYVLSNGTVARSGPASGFDREALREAFFGGTA
jgi:ABC-type branched-subunit amino acid transport system ATPase component